MKTLTAALAIIAALLVNAAYGQVTDDPAYIAYHEKYPAGPPLTSVDSALFAEIPELPADMVNLRSSLLPVVDNSSLPYLRPVFNQSGASCGQASAIGYNFTYEMCHARGVSAHDSTNQYSTHFTWNFMNGGNGWFGVSYIHSFEILRTCGNPDVPDYGGYIYDDGRRWISGYDKYHNSMHNRIRHVFQIKTDSEEGILQLKNWIYDHLGLSNEGGVASFYANTPWNAQKLNDTTPEGGKRVVVGWYPSATHAMTIVGFNDSIRWDYNGDGQYTNDIDINGDGIVNARDWEKGAVKFVNSHGLDAQDSGFCYMMYRVLAEEFENGGIWNQAVHILEVNEDYEPQLTLKVTLKHDFRKAVRVRAGVSTDTADAFPAQILSFPIFNYQGANHYLQGQDTAEYLKTIEFGLDITPLASHVKDADIAEFFILVDEDDPYNNGTGELIACSLMDYTASSSEIPFPGLPVPLVENGQTVSSVTHAIDEITLHIQTANLPPFEAGSYYQKRIDATGGMLPYEWEIRNSYIYRKENSSMPQINGIQLIPNVSSDSIIPIALDFPFPFHGKLYDTVFVHPQGFLQFQLNYLPWPYFQDRDLLFRKHPVVAAFVNELFRTTQENNGVWYEGGPDYAAFLWNVSRNTDTGPVFSEFAIRLYPTGDIEIIYGDCEEMPYEEQVGGISRGNLEYYDYIDFPEGESTISGEKHWFTPLKFPTGMIIDPGGLFKGVPEDESYIYDITFEVKDDNYVVDRKTLSFTSGLLAEFSVDAGGDDKVEYGETVFLDVWIKNVTSSTIQAPYLDFSIADPFITVTDGMQSFGDLAPGASLQVNNAISFDVAWDIPDLRNLLFEAVFSSGKQTWIKEVFLKAHAPVLELSGVFVDTEDGIFYPGEAVDLIVGIRNSGHSTAISVLNALTALEPGITVNGNGLQDYGDLSSGQRIERAFSVSSSYSVANGTLALFESDLSADNGIATVDTFALRVGKVPVLVIDLDPNNHSGPHIKETLDDMGVISVYEKKIPSQLQEYQSIFLCLGIFNSNILLNWIDGLSLANYLEAGGNMYLESRTTWLDDPQTPLQPLFSLVPHSQPVHTDTLSGITGYFTEGLKYFNTSQYPVNFYYLTPAGNAFTIFKTRDNGLGTAIAHETENYRTIGTIFEFGELAGLNENSTREELMQRYLDFFGIVQFITSVEEPFLLPDDEVSPYPNPSSGPVNFSLRLDGPSKIDLEVFTLQGTRIFASSTQAAGPGNHTIRWHPHPETVIPGMYIYRLRINEEHHSGKILIINW